jgi:hypothetical protein
MGVNMLRNRVKNINQGVSIRRNGSFILPKRSLSLKFRWWGQDASEYAKYQWMARAGLQIMLYGKILSYDKI